MSSAYSTKEFEAERRWRPAATTLNEEGSNPELCTMLALCMQCPRTRRGTRERTKRRNNIEKEKEDQ